MRSARAAGVALLLLWPAVGIAAKPLHWQTLADCAGTYRANSQIRDPDRASAMKAMIADQSNMYIAAAKVQFRKQTQGSAAAADKSVTGAVTQSTRRFAKMPRPALERFIEACPQPDN